MSGRGLVAASSSDLPLLFPGLMHASGHAAPGWQCLPPGSPGTPQPALLQLRRLEAGQKSLRCSWFHAPWLVEKMHLLTQAQHRRHPVHTGSFPGYNSPCPTDKKLPGREQPEPGTGPCRKGMTKIALAPISRRPREQAGACSTAILALSREHSPLLGKWGGKAKGAQGWEEGVPLCVASGRAVL